MADVKCRCCNNRADYYDAYMCVRCMEERKVEPTAAGTKVATTKQEIPYKVELLGICRQCVEKERIRNGKPSAGLVIFLGIMAVLCIAMAFYIYPQTNGDTGALIGVCVICGGLTALWIGLAIGHIVKRVKNVRMSPEEYFEQNKDYLTSLQSPTSIQENGHTYRFFYVRLHDDGKKHSGDDKVYESIKNFGKSVSHLTPENKVAVAESYMQNMTVH